MVPQVATKWRHIDVFQQIRSIFEHFTLLMSDLIQLLIETPSRFISRSMNTNFNIKNYVILPYDVFFAQNYVFFAQNTLVTKNLGHQTL